jgi:hypothetical protein
MIVKKEKANTYYLTPEAYSMMDELKKETGISKDLIVSLSIEMTFLNKQPFLEYHHKREVLALEAKLTAMQKVAQ